MCGCPTVQGEGICSNTRGSRFLMSEVPPVSEREIERTRERERERDTHKGGGKRKRCGGTEELQTVGAAESWTSIPVLHSETWRERDIY